MPDQSKPPLKVDQSCRNFRRKLSLYQRRNFYWSGPLEGHIRNFHFRCVCACVCGGAGLPSWGECRVYHNIASLKPLLNFLLVLTIKGDILGTFGALHV